MISNFFKIDFESVTRGPSYVKLGFIWLGYNDRLQDSRFVDVYGRKPKEILDPARSDINLMKKHKFLIPYWGPNDNCISMFFNIQALPDDWEKTAFMGLTKHDCAKSLSNLAVHEGERPLIKEMTVICEKESKFAFKSCNL